MSSNKVHHSDRQVAIGIFPRRNLRRIPDKPLRQPEGKRRHPVDHHKRITDNRSLHRGRSACHDAGPSVVERVTGIWNEVGVEGLTGQKGRQLLAIDRRSYWQDVLTIGQVVLYPDHLAQICSNFLPPTPRQQGYPLLRGVKTMLRRILFARDSRQRQFRQRMPDESRIHPACPVKTLFKRKNNHHPADPLLHPTQPLTLPRPKLRTDKIEDRNIKLFQLTSKSKVHIREVDQHRHIRPPFPNRSDQTPVGAINVRRVADDLRDAHMGYILGTNNAIKPSLCHLPAAKPKKLRLRIAFAQFGDNLRAIMVSTGFTGGEKDTRIGCGPDRTSVDFSRGDCMTGRTTKRFRATLEPLEGGLGWVIARLPFDVQATWKNMVRLRVKVKVGGEIFRTSLFADAHHGGHFLLVNKKMQKAAAARVGTMVDFTIAPDLEERSPAMPPELAKLLKSEKALAKWFAGLSESTRWEIAKWIECVKSAEARQRRAEQMAERLMLTMESEKVLPPILEVAFHNAPTARKGWDAMTPTHRRGQLMAIFYYQSPEARQKRVNKVIQDALRIAETNRH